MEDFPSYISDREKGLFQERIEELESRLNPCVLCPRACRADRQTGDVGYCKAPNEVYISSAFAHFGEERELRGVNGSGTIFFSHCNLKCVFCQNYEISIYGEGFPFSYGQLADLMVRLQDRGCHNINLVTPTHYVPQIVKALSVAIDKGLTIPLVYNCGGYESLEVIRLLDGIVDIYMPDIKFLDEDLSSRFCKARDYPKVAKDVVKEMHRQVGDLATDTRGIARKGLLIRHLVMPSLKENSKKVLRFIGEEVSRHAFVNVMSQYHPCHNAKDHKEISVRILKKEYDEVIAYGKSIGLDRASNH
jgi:putative pyruvate formate lyase activating enzyme